MQQCSNNLDIAYTQQKLDYSHKAGIYNLHPGVTYSDELVSFSPRANTWKIGNPIDTLFLLLCSVCTALEVPLEELYEANRSLAALLMFSTADFILRSSKNLSVGFAP